MSSKPKNLSEAIEALEDVTHSAKDSFKSKLQSEIHKLEEQIESLKPQLEHLKEEAQVKLKKTKDSVESQVKDNPWASIGIVGLVFFILGFLFAARGSRKSD